MKVRSYFFRFGARSFLSAIYFVALFIVLMQIVKRRGIVISEDPKDLKED